MLPKRVPVARLLDVKTDATSQTTYTFTDCNIGHIGSNLMDTATNPRNMKTISNKSVILLIHSIDDATNWSVGAVTVGGASYNSVVDRIGGTNAVNTCIFALDSKTASANTTTTTVSVQFSEAVTCCSIGLIEIENVMTHTPSMGTNTTTSTGAALTSSIGANSVQPEMFSLALVASTVSGTGQTLDASVPSVSPLGAPVMLYEEDNGLMGYAAYYMSGSQYAGFSTSGHFQATLNWSGATANDLVWGIWK